MIQSNIASGKVSTSLKEEFLFEVKMFHPNEHLRVSILYSPRLNDQNQQGYSPADHRNWNSEAKQETSFKKGPNPFAEWMLSQKEYHQQSQLLKDWT
ncbi:unnamed protein product [Hermetia illucens]|uniref:Uncharacterized protein n=1 Tax=Hermetia illucens TaxID=343691 RepID=A0A7R8V4T8_HERIL|nr:unnamed protein product [Hermetia illucens]